jgi:hypothetical protein
MYKMMLLLARSLPKKVYFYQFQGLSRFLNSCFIHQFHNSGARQPVMQELAVTVE